MKRLAAVAASLFAVDLAASVVIAAAAALGATMAPTAAIAEESRTELAAETYDRLMATPQKSVLDLKPAAPSKPKQAAMKAKTPKTAFDNFLAGEFAEAKRLAEADAVKGDAAAMHLLGYLYENGLGVVADVGFALKYFGDAAALGNPDAYVSLGDMALEGRAVMRDAGRAAKWYQLAVDAGDARAEARLAQMHLRGLGIDRDAETAFALYEKAAAKGDPDALVAIGEAYLTGDGKQQDIGAAATMFTRAAEAGHPEAAYNLALMFDSPALGAPDAARAVALMRYAAESGYAPALTAMGLFAHRGDADGVAADWFEAAARAGDRQGLFFFAVALAEGDGRTPDPDLSRKIAAKLADDPQTEESVRANARRLLDRINGDGKIMLRD